MTVRRGEIYLCEVCGIIAEVLDAGAGEMVCCGRPMTLQTPGHADEGADKHVPVLRREGGTVVVEVGATTHPMEPKHYIQMIDVQCGAKSGRVFLEPGEVPNATFAIGCEGAVTARALCNIHGLWKGDEDDQR